MTEKEKDDNALGCALGVVLLALTLPLILFKTWVVVTIWHWFAPWPLPFGVVHGAGIWLAVGLVTTRISSHKDERTAVQKFADVVNHSALTPAFALGFAWILRLFL